MRVHHGAGFLCSSLSTERLIVTVGKKNSIGSSVLEVAGKCHTEETTRLDGVCGRLVDAAHLRGKGNLDDVPDRTFGQF